MTVQARREPPSRRRGGRGRLPVMGIGVLTTLMLAGCGGASAPEAAFKPYSYGYLTPLRLNVGQIRIEDHVPPAGDPADLGPTAPVPPDQALRQMAQDRLVAAGNAGTAVFTIDEASITGQPGGALNGALAVHLDIVSNSGGHSGYAEAHVSRQFVPGSDTGNDGLKSQLYGLTSQMMQDMNVEFEFQLRRTLGDWMLDASGAPVAATVEQQPLSGSGPGPAGPPAPLVTAPASVGAPMQLAPPPGATPMPTPPPAPDSIGPAGADPSANGPLPLSPPAGYLQAPPGVTPVDPSVPAAPPPYPPVPGDAPNGASGAPLPTPSGY